MLLMIDNYDSFTYNLVQYFFELGQNVEVFRNDQISIEEIETKSPDFLVISPGPCTPKEAGISVAAVSYFAGKIPILGVCLGHQSIGAAYGAEIISAKKIMHGKLSNIIHNQTGIFSSIDNENKIVFLKIMINPLVRWVWIGGYILVFGTLIALWPRKEK